MVQALGSNTQMVPPPTTAPPTSTPVPQVPATPAGGAAGGSNPADLLRNQLVNTLAIVAAGLEKGHEAQVPQVA